MTNFLDSIQIGLNSAIDRERNFTEIHDVFKLLKDQVYEVSKNKVVVELFGCEFDSRNSSFRITNDEFLTSGDGLYKDKLIYLSLLENIDFTYFEISRIDFTQNGYPCKLIVDGNQYEALDKNGLEEIVKILFSSPATGQKLYQLMSGIMQN